MQICTRTCSVANGCPGSISAPFAPGTVSDLHNWTCSAILLPLLSWSGLARLLLLLSPLSVLPLPPPQAFLQHGQLPAGYKRQPGTASPSSPASEGACGPFPPGLRQRTCEGCHEAQFNIVLPTLLSTAGQVVPSPTSSPSRADPRSLLWRLRQCPLYFVQESSPWGPEGLGFISASSLFLPEDWQVACKPLPEASSDVSGFLRGAAMWISVLWCGSPRLQCPSSVT